MTLSGEFLLLSEIFIDIISAYFKGKGQMMKVHLYAILIACVFLFATPFIQAGKTKTTETEQFEVTIESFADWCDVEIYGMGKSPSADMVRFFVSGKKKQVEKIYNGQTKLENSIRIIKISNEPTGVCKVNIGKGDLVIAGPWINESLSSIMVEDKEFSDPWNTKYFYFYTEPFCDPAGQWINASQDGIIKLTKSKSLYNGEVVWVPSGDKFSVNSFIAGDSMMGNWKHGPTSAVGTFEGELNDDCTSMKITASTGNYDWSETTWNRDQENTVVPNTKPVNLTGSWYYAKGDGLVKISPKTKNDFTAEVTWVPENEKYKINIRLMGNTVFGAWFDSKGAASGTFTGLLKLDDDENPNIEITESTGPLEWSGYTWIKGKPGE